MSITVVVGAQWGDEGKGKLIDVMAAHSHVVVRYQGGSNAGHTLVVNGKKTILHLVPSGILHKKTICVITSGVVIDIFSIIEELDKLIKTGMKITPKQLLISDRATVLLPYHKLLDKARELEASPDNKIGTTGKGIGPAYEDRASRRALVMSDIFDHKKLKTKLALALKEKNALLKDYYKTETVDAEDLYKKIVKASKTLKEFRLSDSSLFLHQKIKAKKRILFEGAQGALLDINHGTYPFVTSSSTLSSSGAISAGVGPHQLSRIIGAFKAYCTRVGSGPFPTELKNKDGTKLRDIGHEYGSTTGRERRCGWLDLVALKYSIRLNGINSLALMKLDVLSHFDDVYVCTSYKINGKKVTEFPTSAEDLAQIKPVLEKFPGWKTDLTQIKNIKDLPQKTKNYINFIQKFVDCPIDVVSVGPDRSQTLWVKPLYKE